MRVFVLFLSCILLSSWYRAGDPAEPVALFPVYQKGQYGYVNEKGRMLIKPRFQQVGPFSNGLASVQEDGHFGYINTQGQYVIEPQFDEAHPFQDGYAAVSLHSIKYLIDIQGHIQFEHSYKNWEWAEKPETRNHLVVTANDGRQGLVDLKGQVILDVIYDQINTFSEGLATVSRHTIPAEGVAKSEVAVFNLAGEMIVPFGRFDRIGAFKNGYAMVSQQRKRGDRFRELTGVINQKGELQFLLKDKLIDFIDSERMYQEGLAEIAIYTVDRDTLSSGQHNETDAYRGVINSEGKIVFSHPQVKDITPFENGRAFAKTTSHSWVLIDSKGKRVGDKYYLTVPEAGFENGTAVVSMEEGLGLINTEGKLLLPLANLQTTYYQRQDNVVFYEVEILEKDTYVRRWGFWDLQTGFIQSPRYTKTDLDSGFKSGLVQVEENGRQGYVSKKGKYVWRAARG